MKHLRTLFPLFFSIVVISACTPDREKRIESPRDETRPSPLVFEALEHDFGVIKQSGGIVQHDFVLTYNGEEPLSITSTPGNCACTTAEIDKTLLNKGDQAVLTVAFNPNLHAEPKGKFYKTVALITDPPLNPVPEVKIWQEIDLDLGEEAFELFQHLNSSDDQENNHEIAQDASIAPLGKNDGIREFTLEARELVAPLNDDLEYHYWTFNGKVPGTFLRARVDERIRITLKNSEDSLYPHSIDLHAVNGPYGGATNVYPGEEKTFEFKALNPGVYVYHCMSPEATEHMANGMYGLIVIEPRDGYAPVDKEYYLMQGEIYSVLDRGGKGKTQFSGEKLYREVPDYYVFNGRENSLMEERALSAEVGDRIRLFVGNGGVANVSNFHVVGEIFDTVYPEGGTPVQYDIQTTVIPAGGATIVEFTVDAPGVYRIVDHAFVRMSKGALAELIVNGKDQPDVFEYQ